LRNAAAALALLVAACGRGPAPPAGARTVRDAYGDAVSLPARVTRVVATVPSHVEIVLALGARDRLVGAGASGRLPAEAAGVRRIPTYPTVSSEGLAELAPDLVLVDPTLSPRDLPPIRERFPAFATDSRSLDGLRATLVSVGEALGAEDAAARLASDLDRARSEAAGRARGARVLAGAGGDTFHALGPGALVDDLLRAVGATNVAADLGRPSAPVSDERVVEWAPDWVLLVGGGTPAEFAARFPRARAVAAGRVVDANVDDLVRAGPRTAGALRRLARVLAGDAPPATLAREGT
jgi:iron complex transport system substrate-binding protein